MERSRGELLAEASGGEIAGVPAHTVLDDMNVNDMNAPERHHWLEWRGSPDDLQRLPDRWS